MSDDLVTWLRAQLDEDERRAEDCAEPFLLGDRTGMSGLHPMILGHVRRWTPARVLAEVEAKRRMLDWCDRMVIVDGHGGLMARDARLFRRLLALPYADRPGYREEWRP